MYIYVIYIYIYICVCVYIYCIYNTYMYDKQIANIAQ